MLGSSVFNPAAARARFSAVALLVAVPGLAGAQPAQPPAAAQEVPPTVAPVAPAPSPLSQIPGVTIRYYDVSGVTIEQLRASIGAQRPVNAATGVATPSSANWTIRTSIRRQTTGQQCRVVGATPIFAAEVVLPRLVNVETVPAPVLANWQAFVTSLEQQQADRLRYVHGRLSEVTTAVMASTCEGANAAANQAITAISAPPPPPPAPAAPAQPAQ